MLEPEIRRRPDERNHLSWRTITEYQTEPLLGSMSAAA